MPTASARCRSSSRRTDRPVRHALLLALVAWFASAPPAAAGLPHDLDNVSSIESARTRLLNLRDSGRITHDEMMAYARELEPKLRGRRMEQWRVQNAGSDLLGIERSGSSPAAGRGIFGDEDLQTKTQHQYEELLDRARNQKYTILQDPDTPYRFRIVELDTVVWRPTGDSYARIVEAVAKDPNAVIRLPRGVDVPGVALGPYRQLPTDLDAATRLRILQDLADRGETFDVTLGDRTISPTRPPPAEGIAVRREQALRQAHDPEVAFTGRPGSRLRPSDGLEAALENTTKGGKGLFEPVSKSPTPAEQLELIGAGKDVWRSLQATGLCETTHRVLCEKLDRVRRMQEPLSALGLGDAQQVQARLQELQAEAILRGRQIFSSEVDDLARLLADPERASDPLLAQRLSALESQADRMALRFQEIARANPGFAGRLGLSAEEFWSEQMAGVRRLRAQHARSAQDAVQNAAGFRTATVVVNTLQLAECLQRETPEPTGSYDEDVAARSGALSSCLLEFASGELIGEAGSRLVLRFTSPTGVLVARGVARLAGGAGLVMSLIEIGRAGWEAIRLVGAWQEEWLAEERAEEMARQLAERRHEEVPHFAADLGALAGEVERTRAGLENERDRQKAELTALSSQIGELLELRAQDQELRAALREAEQRAGCAEVPGPDGAAPRDGGPAAAGSSAEALAERAEEELRSGLAAANSCKSPEALARAQASLRQAEGTLARLELEGAGTGDSAGEDAGEPVAPAGLLRERADAIATKVREAAEVSEQFRTLREEAHASRVAAGDRAGALRADYDRFVSRFNEDLLAMERAQVDRVGALARAIDTIPEIPLGETFFAGIDRQRSELEMVVIPGVRDGRLGVERGIGELERCLAALRPGSPEAVDTALTVGRLADATLGRDLRGRIDACAARLASTSGAPADGEEGGLLSRQRADLERDLAACEKDLACLEEGKRRHPDAWLDCNGSYTLNARDTAISDARKRCEGLRAELGEPPARAAGGREPPRELLDREALEADLVRWQEQIACLERSKEDEDGFGASDCNTFRMGSVDAQIAALRADIARARERLGRADDAGDPLPAAERAVAPGQGLDGEMDTPPWEHAEVQRLTDEWLSRAVAATTAEGRPVRYNEWAQPLAPGARSTGAPEHPPDWSRHRYLWETRARWTSTNLCSLGDFLERRMEADGVADCASEGSNGTASTTPAPAAPEPAAPTPSRGWSAAMPVTGETARSAPGNGGRGWSSPMETTGSTRKSEPASAHPSAASARAAAPPAAPASAGSLGGHAATPRPQALALAPSGDPFVGDWSCRLHASQEILTSRNGDDRLGLSIRRGGTGYLAEINGDVLTGQRVSANEARFAQRGSRNGTSFQAGLDVAVSGGRLSGRGGISLQDSDGEAESIPFSLDCGR